MILLYLFIFLIIFLKFGSVHPELEPDQVYKKNRRMQKFRWPDQKSYHNLLTIYFFTKTTSFCFIKKK